jgi:hypothetical protein
MISGSRMFNKETVWYVNKQSIENVRSQEILGCNFNNDGSASAHVQRRLQRCRQSYFNLSEIGMSHPGLDSLTKAHLWRTICAPTLLYGCESLALKERDICKMESAQATLLKKALGLGKRSHHSKVLYALHVPKVSALINKQVLSLYNRIFTVDSPTRGMCLQLMNLYLCNGKTIPGTLLHKVKALGHSPIASAFCKSKGPGFDFNHPEDGVVASLRYLLCHENYIKPYSTEHVLATLLTKAF